MADTAARNGMSTSKSRDNMLTKGLSEFKLVNFFRPHLTTKFNDQQERQLPQSHCSKAEKLIKIQNLIAVREFLTLKHY